MYTDDLAIKYLREFFPKLLERLSDMERRLEALEGPGLKTPSAVYSEGPLSLDMQSVRVTWRGRPVSISATQVKIVHLLATTKGRCWSRDELITHIRLPDLVDERAVDSHVKHTRRGFRKIDPNFNRIKTYYGVGYYWEV